MDAAWKAVCVLLIVLQVRFTLSYSSGVPSNYSQDFSFFNSTANFFNGSDAFSYSESIFASLLKTYNKFGLPFRDIHNKIVGKDDSYWSYLENLSDNLHLDVPPLTSLDEKRILENAVYQISPILSRFVFDKDCKSYNMDYSEKMLLTTLDSIIFKNQSQEHQNQKEKSWKNPYHPYTKLIKLFDGYELDENVCSQPKKYVRYMMAKRLSNFKPELKEYLARTLALLNIIYRHNYNKIGYYVCKQFYGVKPVENLKECVRDMYDLFENLLGADSEITKLAPSTLTRRPRELQSNRDEIKPSEFISRQGTFEPSISEPTFRETEYIIVSDEEVYDKDFGPLLAISTLLLIGVYSALAYLLYDTFSKNFLRNLGSKGPKGFKGPSGPKGTNGVNGVDGAMGDMGANGPKGFKGLTGMPGFKGLMGFKGLKGNRGMIGASGFKGLKGGKGAKGIPGVPGATGEPGVTGEQGYKGMKGLKGEPNPGKGGGPTGRRKRAVDMYTEIDDSATVLNSLYNKRLQREQAIKEAKLGALENRFNHIWSEQRDGDDGCPSCSLFYILEHKKVTDLEAYIMAAFSHILGNTDSLKVLDDVFRGKRLGLPMKCKRKKRSCEVEYVTQVVF